LQLGDGDTLGLYPPNPIDKDDIPKARVRKLLIADERNFGGATMSLCNLKNSSEIQHSILIGKDIPMLITISTDGIFNSYDDRVPKEENGFYKIPTIMKRHLLANDLDTTKVMEILEKQLKDITINGSGDDVTLGVLFNETEMRLNVPKEETLVAIQDVNLGRNMSTQFHSVKELMEDLDADD